MKKMMGTRVTLEELVKEAENEAENERKNKKKQIDVLGMGYEI